MKKVLINVEDRELRVAILEDDQLAELYFESFDEKTILNNIYKGSVEGVIPGLKAAFVNIGLERNAFLHFDDIRPDLLYDKPVEKPAAEVAVEARPEPEPEPEPEPVLETAVVSAEAVSSELEYTPSQEELAAVEELSTGPAPLPPIVEQEQPFAPGGGRRRRRRGRRGGRRRHPFGEGPEGERPEGQNRPDGVPEEGADDQQPASPPQPPVGGQSKQGPRPDRRHDRHDRRNRGRDRDRGRDRQPQQPTGDAQSQQQAFLWQQAQRTAQHGTRAATDPFDVYSPYSQRQQPGGGKRRQKRRGRKGGGEWQPSGPSPGNQAPRGDSQADFFPPDDEGPDPFNRRDPRETTEDHVEEEYEGPAPGNERFPDQNRPAGQGQGDAKKRRRGRGMRRRGPSYFAARKKDDKPEGTKPAKTAKPKKTATKDKPVATQAAPKKTAAPRATKKAAETKAPVKTSAKAAATKETGTKRTTKTPATKTKAATARPKAEPKTKAKTKAAPTTKAKAKTAPLAPGPIVAPPAAEKPKRARARKPAVAEAPPAETPAKPVAPAPAVPPAPEERQASQRPPRMRRGRAGKPEKAKPQATPTAQAPETPAMAQSPVAAEHTAVTAPTQEQQAPAHGRPFERRSRRDRRGRRGREQRQLQQPETTPGAEPQPRPEQQPPLPPPRRRPRIRPVTEALKKGDEILVQVIKEQIGLKGARISSYISLPGRYLVMLPYPNEEGGISRKVENIHERKRLKRLLRDISKDDAGFIVRTAGIDREEGEIRGDVEYLSQEWNGVVERASTAHAPSLVYDDHDILYRLARDTFDESVSEILIDSPFEADKLRKMLQKLAPQLVDRVKVYEEPENIFQKFGVEKQIQKACRRKVWLKSGGYLIIDEAEALTAIDVNTGKFIGKDDQEKMILKNNLEAAKAIARELRLRDIGGLIVVDFIDMKDPRNREQLLHEFRAHLRKDRSKTSVSSVSEFGLVEMTRKRVRRSLRKTLFMDCPYCQGAGVVLNERQIWLHIKEDLLNLLRGENVPQSITIITNPKVRSFIDLNYRDALQRLEQKHGVDVNLSMSDAFHVENYAIESSGNGRTERQAGHQRHQQPQPMAHPEPQPQAQPEPQQEPTAPQPPDQVPVEAENVTE